MLQLHIPVPLRLSISTPDSISVPTNVIGSATFYYKYLEVAIVRTPALYLFTSCESIPLVLCLSWLLQPHQALKPLTTLAPFRNNYLAHTVHTLSLQGHNT